jgi:hypothetical protein
LGAVLGVRRLVILAVPAGKVIGIMDGAGVVEHDPSARAQSPDGMRPSIRERSSADRCQASAWRSTVAIARAPAALRSLEAFAEQADRPRAHLLADAFR